MTSGVDDGSRVVTLWFSDESSQPMRVAKTARHPNFDEQIAREQSTLAHLHRMLPEELAVAVPMPLAERRDGTTLTVTESWTPGTRVIDLAWRRNRAFGEKQLDLRLAAHWLRRAHRHLEPSERASARAWFAGSLDMPAAVRSMWARHYPDALLTVDATRQRVERLVDDPLSVTLRHRDFTPWNVLRDGAHLSVIDWENASPDAPPGPGICDLLYFTLHWGCAVDGRDDSAAWLLALLGPAAEHTDAMQAASEEIDRYRAAFEISRDYLIPFWIVMLLEHGVERERRERHLGERQRRSHHNEFAGLLAALLPLVQA